MAIPRPKKRRLTSPCRPLSDPEDAGHAHETRENATELLTRLQDPYGDMIRIHISDDPKARPVLLQRALVERVSPWWEQWIRRNMRDDGSRDLYLDTGNAMTRKMGLFWIMKNRIATIAELDAEVGVDEYQTNLIRMWYYARETQVPALQNAVMKRLKENMRGVVLSLKVLREGLAGTGVGCKMRAALMDEMLWIHAEEGVAEEKLVRDLLVNRVRGWEEDYERRKRAFQQRGGIRVKVEEFLVEE